MENKDYKILQKEYLLFEIQISLDVNPISHRHKIKMNRIFREIVKTNSIPFPEVDTLCERLKSKYRMARREK